MHLAPLIRDLAIILGVAAVVTFIFRRIRQPVVLGYIIAGVIVGPHTPTIFSISDLPNVQTWAELGVIFLMFTLGLEFSFRKLAKVGLGSGGTALFEMSIMIFLGLQCGQFLGWPPMDSLFLGCMIAISSTTIIVKALDELGLKTRQFAESIVGILIFEDMVAVLMLVALSSVAIEASLGVRELALAGVKLVFVVSIWVLVGLFVVPRFVRSVGRHGNDEMLTVVSLGLCLSLVAISASFNYSVALGAFIMGSILSESAESHRIEQLVKPLRDTFGAVFFVSVGMLIDPRILVGNFGQVIVLSLVVMIGKATAITVGSMLNGKSINTSISTGFSMAQIGEFSFIIATLGTTYGIISKTLYPMIVAVSLVTTFATPYMIRMAQFLGPYIEKRLPPSVASRLDRYRAFTQRRGADLGVARAVRLSLVRWVASAILVIAIFGFMSGTVLPWMRQQIPDLFYATLAGWALSIAVTSPFIWSMLIAFRTLAVDPSGPLSVNAPRLGAIFISRFLTILIVGGLSMRFFVTWLAMALTVAMAIVFYLAFARQLDGFYGWFEGQMRDNVRGPDADKKKKDRMAHHLAPWNTHMARVNVHSDSTVSGKRIKELQFRERHGVNIVAIQRGSRTIVPPSPDEIIFPEDHLLVLGTDDQIELLRGILETPQPIAAEVDDLEHYKLRQMTIFKDSPLVGRTIRNSGIREDLQSLVVGLERGAERMLNPQSDVTLMTGDRLWLVGNPGKIETLTVSHAPELLRDNRPLR